MIMHYLVSPLSQYTVVYCVVSELVKKYYFKYLVGLAQALVVCSDTL